MNNQIIMNQNIILKNNQKYFIQVLRVYTQNIINQTLITLIVVKTQHIPQTPTPNTDGRNSSPSVFIFLITVIIIFLYALLDTITSSEQKEHGKEEEKNHQQQSVEKQHMFLTQEDLQKYGEMDNRLVLFSMLMNVQKQLVD